MEPSSYCRWGPSSHALSSSVNHQFGTEPSTPRPCVSAGRFDSFGLSSVPTGRTVLMTCPEWEPFVWDRSEGGDPGHSERIADVSAAEYARPGDLATDRRRVGAGGSHAVYRGDGPSLGDIDALNGAEDAGDR